MTNCRLISFSISHNQEVVAGYLCFLAQSLQRHPVLHLPVLAAQTSTTTDYLIFPPVLLSDSFWQNLQTCCNIQCVESVPDQLLQEALSAVSSYCTHSEQIPGWWQPTITAVLDALQPLLHASWSVPHLQIVATTFGYRYKVIRQTGSDTVVCFARLDCTQNDLKRAVLQAVLISPEHQYESPDYTRGVMDLIIRNSHLQSLFTDSIEPTQSTDLNQSSKQYLSMLGLEYPNKKQLQVLHKLFSAQEKKVCELLLLRQNQVVSFKELSLQLWEVGTPQLSKPLPALAKIVETMRKKIIKSGLRVQLIYTLRKQGYMWRTA